MVTSALAVVMSRPGTALDVGERLEQVLVDADGHHVQRSRGTRWSRWMSSRSSPTR
jgi:hypothetical protein